MDVVVIFLRTKKSSDTKNFDVAFFINKFLKKRFETANFGTIFTI